MNDIPDIEVEQALGKLAQWSAGLTWGDVPESVREHAALILVDDFAALLAARDEPELIALRAGLAQAAGRGEATVLDGSGTRQDRYSAALSNGAAADWCELDGGYRKAVCHAALYCIPALLAEGEASEATLRDMLLALITGYETVARVAMAFSFPGLVLHPHGGLATVGAAAAIAKLRKLPADQTTATICTAATLVLPGPFGHAIEGALIRNVWPGICAQNGIRAADWAPLGITGGPQGLTDVFARIFGATTDAPALCEGLGASWAMNDAYHKMHACCQYAHSTVEAVLTATGKSLDPADVMGIEVATHWKGRKLDNAQPETTLAAKFSIQHIAAATLVFGHAGAGAFHATTLGRPDLVRLRNLVTITAHEPERPPPHDRPARVKITLADGRILQGECLSAPGGSDLPFTPELIARKALDIVTEAYPQATDAIHALLALEPEILDRPWGKTLSSLG
ncbi:MAG: MmgE/PrpD family protein [Pseudorhodobacter sp.]